ncbi:L-arabinose-responsive transcription regulator ARA1 [Metarhizium brunneum]|uniref:L-arabinose-responsive transcription regulator ARA1 n=1 Tax=Metarhizium brunneum TaxID=500148 RepID=A0A7D5UUE9_9HYPO|nr:L-arabinose-responsive transcription regulator ARA1 [Metarhizium brunneum]
MLLYTRLAAPKVPRKRSRAGCNYCKDKKKKCDELRPTCSRCQEHGEECRYEPVKPRQRHKIEVSNKKVSNEESPLLPGDSKSCVSVQTTPDHQLALTGTSTSHETDHPVPWDSSESISKDCGRDSLGPLGHDSLPLLRNGTQHLPGSLLVHSKSSHNPSLPLTAPAATPSPLFEFCAPAFEEFSNDYHHRVLVNHFCNTLSHLIVLREDEGNPFQQLVLPLAHNSPAVKSAIYALASAHLEGNRAQMMENDQKSIQFHNEAVRNLANLIGKGNNGDKNELLATIILLVYYEVLVQRRRSNLVEGHLKGAMAIMRNGPTRNDQTSLFLDRAFRFYDVIAALSSGTAPVSDHPSCDSFTGLLEQTDSQGSSSPPVSVDALLGLATSLWPVIHRLSGLLTLKNCMEESVSRGDFSGTADLRARFGAECAAVESSLEEWQPMLPVVCDPQTNLEQSTASFGARMSQFQSIFNTALAYRHSALVYLHRTIYDSPRGDPTVQRHTSISLVHCEATVRHEGPMGALLWPLFVASCEAVEPTDRDLASKAFRGIGQRQGMANIDRAWEVVQEVWNRADKIDDHSPEAIITPGQGKKDLWRRVSEDMGMAIVFG